MFTFENILIYSYLLPFIFFLFLKKEIRTRKEILVIVVYGITFFVLINLQSFLTSRKLIWDHIKDFFFSFYTFTELLFFSLIYWINIKTRSFKILAIIISILFVLFQVIYFFTVKNDQIDNIPVGLETLIMYIYIFCFFYSRFKNIDDQYIYNHYGFWISVGIMLYLGGSFFLFILGNHISDEQIKSYWFLTYIIETVKNILFSVAIVVYAKHRSKEKFPNQKLPFLDFN